MDKITGKKTEKRLEFNMNCVIVYGIVKNYLHIV